MACPIPYGSHKNSEFSRLFCRNNYTFPEVITTKILAIWQHLGRFLAIFSQHMCRNGYFSWHLLGRVATPSHHNDPVYPVNSCYMQIFHHTKMILFVIIFPWGCTELGENSLSFPGSQNSLSIPGLWPPCKIHTYVCVMYRLTAIAYTGRCQDFSPHGRGVKHP